MGTPESAAGTSSPRMPSITDLAEILVSADTTDALVRSLLALVQDATGMESAYFTSLDALTCVQRVDYALNVGALEIPEGTYVPWEQTLCRRALEQERTLASEVAGRWGDEECTFTNDVAGRWGDCDAARSLGIASYLTTPVRIGDGELYGTLCTASSSRIELPFGSRRLLYVCGKLIARQIEHEKLLSLLQRENLRLNEVSLTDPLTGLANRRALLGHLGRRLASTRRSDTPVLLAFIDLDGFKDLNDTHGHDAGDRFLIEMSQRLRQGLREEDVVARHGGDEFVVMTGVALDPGASTTAAQALRERIESLIEGDYVLGPVSFRYPGASVGVVVCPPGGDGDALLAEADAAMYARKRERRAAASN